METDKVGELRAVEWSTISEGLHPVFFFRGFIACAVIGEALAVFNRLPDWLETAVMLQIPVAGFLILAAWVRADRSHHPTAIGYAAREILVRYGERVDRYPVANVLKVGQGLAIMRDPRAVLFLSNGRRVRIPLPPAEIEPMQYFVWKTQAEPQGELA